MSKYWIVFKNSWERELEYRFDFFLGRLRSVVVLLLLYFVWLTLSSKTGRFANYTSAEIITYVFIVNILRSVIFGAQSRRMAGEINDGTFSSYLLKPINHFWYVFWGELAQRSIYFITAIVEVIVFALILNVNFFWQIDKLILAIFAVSIIFSIFLYFIMSYLVSLFAFWSREAMGPRFLFEWFLEFASGAYFPLSILSGIFYAVLIFLPFAYLIYFPVSVYLGKFDFQQGLTGISIQLLFIGVLGFLALFVWKRGLRRYSGEGI